MKKKLAIMLFANKKYIFALGTFIINLKKYISYDCIIIYNSDFSYDDEISIKKIETNIHFIKYTIDDFCNEFSFKKEFIESLPAIKTYGHISPVKFKIFTHLDDFSSIILFDCDMLLLDNISELLNDNYNIAWKTDANSTILSKLKMFGYSIENMKKIGLYDIYSKAITPNGGFFVVNDNFDYKYAFNIAHDYFKKYFPIHPFLMGENTFAYINHILKLNLLEADKDIYNVFPHLITLRSKLIHFFRDCKPWNKEYIQYSFREWVNNYLEYVKITNSTSNQVKIFNNIGQEYIVKHSHNEKWNFILKNIGFKYPTELIPRFILTDSALAFDYNSYITYDIFLKDMYSNRYSCRLWVLDNHPIGKEIIKKEIFNIIDKYKNLKYIQYNKSIGCETHAVFAKNIQTVFDDIYNYTKEIRGL